MIQHNEIWINSNQEVVQVREERTPGMNILYEFRCYHYKTNIFAFTCTRAGKWNKSGDSTSDLVKKLNKEENPEYFL